MMDNHNTHDWAFNKDRLEVLALSFPELSIVKRMLGERCDIREIVVSSYLWKNVEIYRTRLEAICEYLNRNNIRTTAEYEKEKELRRESRKAKYQRALGNVSNQDKQIDDPLTEIAESLNEQMDMELFDLIWTKLSEEFPPGQFLKITGDIDVTTIGNKIIKKTES